MVRQVRGIGVPVCTKAPLFVLRNSCPALMVALSVLGANPERTGLPGEGVGARVARNYEM